MARGMSQATLEALAKLPSNRISKWAAGQGEPTVSQAFRIARILNVDLSWLADEETDTQAPPLHSEQEKIIIHLARVMGFDVAERRLLQIEEVGSSGQFTGLKTGSHFRKKPDDDSAHDASSKNERPERRK